MLKKLGGKKKKKMFFDVSFFFDFQRSGIWSVFGHQEMDICLVRLQIPLFSEQDNFLLKRGLRIIF